VIQAKAEAAGGWNTVDYYYDSSGRGYKVTAPYVTATSDYTTPSATVKFIWKEYDPVGRVSVVHNTDTTTLTYPDGEVVTHAYESSGNLDSLIGNSQYVTAIDYT
jgi:hypothetical protein